MAIKPIRPLYSPSATATNGSDTITVTGDVDCSYIYDGFLVALGTRQVVEAVRGTPPDGSGNSTITLRRNWDAANTTSPLLGWNSIEGLPAAINQLRQIIGDSQDINDQLLPLANLMGSGIIRKTGTETYELLSDTSAGRAILQASDATAQRVALELGTAATADVTTSATDTTAGRVTRVGDGGFGGAILPTGNDANALFNMTRIARLLSSSANAPTDGSGWAVFNFSRTEETDGQFAIQCFSAARAMIRTRDDDWKELYHTGNLPITQSTTDTTAGRLLKVGDFGVGAIANTNLASNINTTFNIPSGSYRKTNPTAAEHPTGSTTDFIFNSAGRLNTTDSHQIAFIPESSSVTNMYLRRNNSGTLVGWHKLYHTGNILGTVSQSAGVPTGAVIERGSNSDGEYVRFADGTQICTRNAAIPDSNAAQDFPYPATFTGSISVSLCGASGELDGTGFANRRRALFITIVSANSSGWRLARDSNTIDLGLAVSGFSARLTAVGRWY